MPNYLLSSFQVVLLINNTEVAINDITLLPGVSVPVTLEVMRTDAGAYTVNLGGEIGEFRIIIETVDTEEGPIDTIEPENNVTTIRWSLVAIIIGAVAVVGFMISIFIYRRRRQGI